MFAEVGKQQGARIQYLTLNLNYKSTERAWLVTINLASKGISNYYQSFYIEAKWEVGHGFGDEDTEEDLEVDLVVLQLPS